jgi:AraC-like DNA-binding protein
MWDRTISITTRQDDIYTLELVTAGEMLFDQDLRQSVVKAGSVFFQNRHSPRFYRTGPAGFVHKRFLSFFGTMADAIVEATGLSRVDCIMLDSAARRFRVGQLFKHADRMMHGLQKENWFDLSQTAYALIMEVSACCGSLQQPGTLQEAVAYLEANLDKQVTVPDIAYHASTSIAHCHRLFLRHFGVPPIKFFLQRRIARAQALLLSTPMSIKEVANALGYADQIAFSAQFKRYSGLSPKAFRKTGMPKSKNRPIYK